jgi:hypothetical protein
MERCCQFLVYNVSEARERINMEHWSHHLNKEKHKFLEENLAQPPFPYHKSLELNTDLHSEKTTE